MHSNYRRSLNPALQLEDSRHFVGFLAAAIVFFCLLAPRSGVAHSGFMDANGCHKNNKLGTFECHTGLLKGQSFKNEEEAAKALEKAKKEESSGKKNDEEAKVDAKKDQPAGKPPEPPSQKQSPNKSK